MPNKLRKDNVLRETNNVRSINVINKFMKEIIYVRMMCNILSCFNEVDKFCASAANGSKGFDSILPPLLVIISIVNQLTRAILPSDA